MNIFYIEGWLFIDNEHDNENVKKSFENYLELPPELRMMSVDEMEPADRCRFSRCSKLSNKEAKISKKYIYSLEFCGVSKDDIRIHVIHGEYQCCTWKTDKKDTGYILEFEKESERKYVKYLNSKMEEYWRIELDSDTELTYFAADYFKKFLQFYQKSIKKLSISYYMYFKDELKDFNFEVEKLNNLEVLSISFNSNILQLYSKIRSPLKKLYVHGEENNQLLADYEFSNIECLDLMGLKLNNEQFLRLTAKEFSIHIGYLTEKDIFDFIRSWQNGTMREGFEHCTWDIDGTQFDKQKLFEMFEEYDPDSEEDDEILYVKHYKEKEKKGKLSFSTLLIFETDESQF